MLLGEVGGAGRNPTTPPSKTTHDGRRASAGADRDLCREAGRRPDGGRRPRSSVRCPAPGGVDDLGHGERRRL
eukprot:4959951-Prymnesium_polylepis.1